MGRGYDMDMGKREILEKNDIGTCWHNYVHIYACIYIMHVNTRNHQDLVLRIERRKI